MPHQRSGAGSRSAAGRPRAVLIGGAPGTGKSTLGAALAPRLRAVLLDLDVVTGPLTEVVSGLVGAADLSDPRIAGLTRGPRYETLFAIAEQNLRAGVPVVLVAPFTAERTPTGWAAVAHRLGHHATLTLVWLHLPPDRLIARLRHRDATRDTGKIDDPAGFLAVHRAVPQLPHLALEATRPAADLADQVIAELAR